MFKEYGQTSGEFLYAATELDNMIASHSNASFDIRRYITNQCGVSLTVQEVGPRCAGRYTWVSSNKYVAVYPLLMARDVVSPGVAVANGEVLRVTYTPQITV